MKVILVADVDRLGSRGDVVEVKDGYANNFLIPKGLAVRLTKGKAKEAEQLAKEKMAKAERELRKAQETAQALSGQAFEVPAKVGEEGRLFGAITSRDIADLVNERLGIQLDRKKIELPESIRTAGFHEAKIKLHPQVEAIIHLKVVPS